MKRLASGIAKSIPEESSISTSPSTTPAIKLTAQQVNNYFYDWSVSLLASRKAADEHIGKHFNNDPKKRGYDNMAQLLWQCNYKIDTPLNTMIHELNHHSDADKKVAGMKLGKLFQYYTMQLRHRAQPKLKNFTEDRIIHEFNHITLLSAFEAEIWKECVNDYTDKNYKFLMELRDALQKIWENSQSSYLEYKSSSLTATTTTIKDTEWTINAPSLVELQTAMDLIMQVMKENTPLTKTTQQLNATITAIQTQEIAHWAHLKKKSQGYVENLQFKPPLPKTLLEQTQVTRAHILQQLHGFLPQLRFPQQNKQAKSQLIGVLQEKIKEFQQINDDPTITARDREAVRCSKELYVKWLNKDHEYRFNQLSLQHYQDIQFTLLNMQQIRGAELTVYSKEVIQQLQTRVENGLPKAQARMTENQSQLEEIANQFKHWFELSSQYFMQDDAIQSLKTLYEEVLSLVKSSEAGLFSTDPYQQRMEQRIQTYIEDLELALCRDLCVCYQIHYESLQVVLHSFSTQMDKIVAQLAQVEQSNIQLPIQKAMDQLKDHIEKLQLQGNPYELITEHTLKDRVPIVCSSKVPSIWITKYAELMQLNSFEIHQLLDQSSSSTESHKKFKTNQFMSEEIFQECQLSLLNKILDSVQSHGRNLVDFATVFDFTQRYHLILLKLSVLEL